MAHRTQFTLTDDQYRRLREEATRTGLSMAELVRLAVERTYGARSVEQRSRALERSFHGWAEHSEGGRAYVDGLRRGMAHRLDRE
ncbi:MAG: ribbon-helix-helix protein, CopG family [Trueperaceae bacterium]|nr:ribbon-helix-helix protein, CopG family [Trueperaceae bacterium]